ncbi:hypothetical protein TCAL_06832 [Tigriopus californicus]|uniref:XK-related protein n=1 Tax=Tigriopus californicus TaxID=6832 RepID=A0A553NSM8_TIGCA|nr:uncharacterized protein LOC131886127 [Tigriopus californicus]XP_059090367.1 uncharacterized protein LOC131886127 [Tigriopus californicus]TRY68445.1 hypothetical protein TCAL_06832 [Tigriopus californicus]|eukprot:TCALIF_06832-PA protein Name:"Protein of unknown function" AED:0.00 eAED:0.00 QI:358/1/1/1/0.75/0.6/5/1077/1099
MALGEYHGGGDSGPPPIDGSLRVLEPHYRVRESFQKHARTISAISDISVAPSEQPLRRDDQAEIKCIFLCDSETERKCVFEAINKALADGESRIQDVKLVQHHWEKPCDDGVDMRPCVAPSPFGNSMGNGTDTPGLADGFFRFTIRGRSFRLMLLSKDKQNLLKIYSFDFVFVGLQVTNGQGGLDENIWEFEWKRLERYSRKAVAPIILLGYFRDVLKLGKGDFCLQRTIQESKERVQKAGPVYRAIPRFCDFVTGDSGQLESVFNDVSRLFVSPGFRLQQCAIINNLVHFTQIVDNPNLTEEDVQYPDQSHGDNPLMIAAKLRHKDLISASLRSTKFTTGGEDNAFLREVMHMRNKNQQTLLAMVALQGPELEEQKLLILQKEIQIHCVSEITHVADQLKLQRCLRSQLKSSAEASIILDQVRALQGIPKTEPELKAEKCKVWSRLFFSSLLLSLVFNAIDTGSDILIMIRYYHEMMGSNSVASNVTCGDDELGNDSDFGAPNCNASGHEPISIQCFPSALSPVQKFGYTLFFILVPWPFFIYEFCTSPQCQQMLARGGEIIYDMSHCRGFVPIVQSYFRAIIYFITFVACLLFWPIAILFIKYFSDGKYYLAKGAQRANREKKIEASEVLYSTARVMEVSLESSFQPTIQLYIIFPVLVRTLTASSFSFRIFTVCKSDKLDFPMLKMDQTLSIITSILSLAWCFTTYHATLKRGALDKDLAALFYRAILFLSVLFQIVGRLFILVLFSYSFGPGQYFPLLIFLGGHIVVMFVLHLIFSDANVYWQKGGVLNISFFHYMMGNSLANIYIHNWIRMDPLLIQFAKPLQHVSTLVRQLIFDLVFTLENIALLVFAVHSNIVEVQENKWTFVFVLMGFTILGLILKCVYYRYLHIWAWLIMDYITKTEDGHWKCILFSNMYFCGSLKEREILLCCIPKPVLQAFNMICGERDFGCRGGATCNPCMAVLMVFIFPIALALALVALTVCIILALLFLPVFLLMILPCAIVMKCRRHKRQSNNNIIKIQDSDSKLEENSEKHHEQLPMLIGSTLAAKTQYDLEKVNARSPPAFSKSRNNSTEQSDENRSPDVLCEEPATLSTNV